MYAPFQSVHAPLEVPEKYEEQYKFINNKARRTYAGTYGKLHKGIDLLFEVSVYVHSSSLSTRTYEAHEISLAGLILCKHI